MSKNTNDNISVGQPPATAPNAKLLFLHVHGLGPASVQYLERLQFRLRRQVSHLLRQHSIEKLAGESYFIICEPRWDDIFNEQKDAWLKSLFPNEWSVSRNGRSPLTEGAIRRILVVLFLMILLVSVATNCFRLWPEANYFLDTLLINETRQAQLVFLLGGLTLVGLLSFMPIKLYKLFGLERDNRRLITYETIYDIICFLLGGTITYLYNSGLKIMTNWIARPNEYVQCISGAIVLCVILILLYYFRSFPPITFLFRLLRWGDLFSKLRVFESQAASDIWIYSNEDHKFRIFRRILDELEQAVREAGIDGGDETAELTLILSGHSMGSIIVSDLLSYINEYYTDENPSSTDTKEEVFALLGRLPRLRVVGMFTYGSPMALFLFRDPELFVRRCDGHIDPTQSWQRYCPPEFQAQFDPNLQPELSQPLHNELPSWCWKNFWHNADFVAHRLEALLNPGRPRGRTRIPEHKRFVMDVPQFYACSDPIEAHGGYFGQESVISAIAKHVASWLEFLSKECKR